MKIIKRGAVQSPTHQATCRHCKSELEFHESEANVQTDRNEVVLSVECPVCKQTVWVSR